MPFDHAAFDETLTNARRSLLGARNAAGHWNGELSSSALSTATAVFALHEVISSPDAGVDRGIILRAAQLIREGLGWLALHQNDDGGWGDTTRSFSNISTTVLCWSAFVADENWAAGAYDKTLHAADQWLVKKAGNLQPATLAQAIEARYGVDRTFSVPILTMCALAGRLGPGKEAWDLVRALPFELAAFPQRGFKWLRLPVVSYALPALIAIGQVHHALRPSRSPPVRFVRSAAIGRTLHLLNRIQPSSGGFLEATPLTSFVLMSLAAARTHLPKSAVKAGDAVIPRGVEFLSRSVRPDGSWPIDANLATWVTTLSVNALASNPDFSQVMPADERAKVRTWLLSQQYRTEHPYTLADPGGWAWTDLPGGVPDADDTPGALLALAQLSDIDDRVKDAAAVGVRWLLDLQNRDGGIPTFCRGWGKLPFDRSSADLTAHTLRAFVVWRDVLPARLRAHVDKASEKAWQFLKKAQRSDGAWVPLWFGNQHLENDVNPTYGTSRVIKAFAPTVPAVSSASPVVEAGAEKLQKPPPSEAPNAPRESPIPNAPPAYLGREQGILHRATTWLLNAQNPDGGWGAGRGTPSSIEETGLAVESLCHVASNATHRNAIAGGVTWLIQHTQRGRSFDPSPIGFYFAKLWYWETLYPLIWTVAALESARALVSSD